MANIRSVAPPKPRIVAVNAMPCAAPRPGEHSDPAPTAFVDEP